LLEQNYKTICYIAGCSLKWQDVFIITESIPRDEDDLVKALRSKGIPVKVVTNWSSDGDLLDMALARHDEVVFTNWRTVSGLERRIVVFNNTSVHFAVRTNYLFGKSRSTSQLVLVE
jgi:hypothetical protein